MRILHILDHSVPLQSGYTFRTLGILKQQRALGWTTTINGQTITGTYGASKSVSGGLISAGTRVYSVSDRTTSTCSTQVTVAPPAPCSVPPTTGCTNNLLTNASFTTNLAAWFGSGCTWQNGNIELCSQGNIAYQTLPAQAGKNYRYEYTARTAGTNQNILFGLKFLSATWQVLGTEYSVVDSPGAFSTNSLQKQAPAGTAWVEVLMYKQNNGCVQVSEVCLTNPVINLQSTPEQLDQTPDPLMEEPSGVVAYPNPTTQQVRIEWQGEAATITVADQYASNGLLQLVNNVLPALDNCWEFMTNNSLELFPNWSKMRVNDGQSSLGMPVAGEESPTSGYASI